MKTITATLLALSLTGCASIINGEEQTIAIEALDATSSTLCVGQNDEGVYRARSGAGMRVKRSSDDLIVRCENKEQESTVVIESRNEWWYYPLNFVAWDLCLISCIVDTATGNIYEYPQRTAVMMDYKPEMTARADQ